MPGRILNLSERKTKYTTDTQDIPRRKLKLYCRVKFCNGFISDNVSVLLDVIAAHFLHFIVNESLKTFIL